MARWYQNVLTGEQREVKSLEEDDFYQDNASNWCRIKVPPGAEKPAPAKQGVQKPAPKAKG